MVKGCQREMILFKTTESEIFESAWLVLRKGVADRPTTDMMAEANRIIGQAGKEKRKKMFFWKQAVVFGAGVLTGSGIFALLLLFLRGYS